MKEAYYFSHDANARRDPKVLAMRNEYGCEGYGWYWILIEMLSEQEGYKLKHTKWVTNAIAMELLCDANSAEKFVNSCIEDYELFSSDGEYFWSESLIRRMNIKEEKRLKKVEAGRKGAQKRWKNDESEAMPKQSHSSAIAKHSKGKESKIKESKENIYTAEFEEFWSLYPRKLDKKKALAKFKTVRKEHSLEIILEGTKKYAQQVKGTESKFIKHPTTFLNNESFVDGYEEVAEQPKQQAVGYGRAIPDDINMDLSVGEDW